MSGNEKINIERRANNKKTLANVHGIRGDLMIITMDRRKKAWVQESRLGPCLRHFVSATLSAREYTWVTKNC